MRWKLQKPSRPSVREGLLSAMACLLRGENWAIKKGKIGNFAYSSLEKLVGGMIPSICKLFIKQFCYISIRDYSFRAIFHVSKTISSKTDMAKTLDPNDAVANGTGEAQERKTLPKLNIPQKSQMSSLEIAKEFLKIFCCSLNYD